MANSPPSGFERAKIEIDGESTTIECWFNPTEYSISKTNLWEFKPAPGTALPPAQFAGGMPRELTVDLFFDASDTNKDVREVTNQLLKMMELGSGGRPPMITFIWGQTNSFKAVAQTMSLRYTLFRPDGSPIRALASLRLAQADKTQDASSPPGGTSGGGNPTTRGIDAIRTHIVRDGDSLQSLAFEAYGDATEWRAIAEANGVDDPLSLRRGRSLIIPREP